MAEKERNKREPHEGRHESLSLSEGKGKASIFARGDEVKSAMFTRKQLLVLWYKDIYFSTNELNLSLPSMIVSLL